MKPKNGSELEDNDGYLELFLKECRLAGLYITIPAGGPPNVYVSTDKRFNRWVGLGYLFGDAVKGQLGVWQAASRAEMYGGERLRRYPCKDMQQITETAEKIIRGWTNDEST